MFSLNYMTIIFDDDRIVYLQKPFYWMLSFFRKSWNIRASVIDSSATFFLLLYVKILSVSSGLLIFTSLYTISMAAFIALYYDSSVTYFGREHLPYAILATFSLMFVIIIPTVVLVLYPFQFFQKFLSCFQYNGIFFMSLWIPFKVLTRMELNLGLVTVADLRSLVYSFV